MRRNTDFEKELMTTFHFPLDWPRIKRNKENLKCLGNTSDSKYFISISEIKENRSDYKSHIHMIWEGRGS